MLGVRIVEGHEQMLLDYLLSKPVGFAIGLLYVAEASSTGLPSGGSGIAQIFANYVAPIGLVIYFLLRDEKRDKLASKAEADRKRIEAAKEEARAEETTGREERMAKRIDVLENYINKTMLETISESKTCVTQLCEKIDTLVNAMKRSECPLVNGEMQAEKEKKTRD